MKKLFNLFRKTGQAQKADAEKAPAAKPSNKAKADGKNGEVTPGTLFEHYKDVLIKPGDILDKLK